MSSLKQALSKNGVTCHKCGGCIRPTKIYYKRYFENYGHIVYKNYCVQCAFKESNRDILEMKEIWRISRRLKKQYEEDDRKICLTCKNRYKQVVGECNPNRDGCRPKPLKEKKCTSPKP